MVMIALTACGDSVPGNAVATVDGKTITRTAFAHWLNIAELQSASAGRGEGHLLATRLRSCVASKRKTAPKPAKGQPSQTDAQLKTVCKAEYESLRDQAMQFLILEIWINGEAKDQGVTLSNAEFNKQYTAAKKQSFPTEKDFQTFLKESGYTVDDTRRQVHWNALYTKLREEGRPRRRKVTDKSIAAFYKKNKAAAVLDAGDPRPARRADEDRGEGQPGQAGAAVRSELEGRREEVLDRPGLQEPGWIAARHPEGLAGEELRHRDLRGGQEQAERPGQDAVRLLRLPGAEDRRRQAAVVEGGDAGHQAAAAGDEPAEGRRRLQHRAAEEVEVQDELRRCVRHVAVQERSEGEDDDDGCSRERRHRRRRRRRRRR